MGGKGLGRRGGFLASALASALRRSRPRYLDALGEAELAKEDKARAKAAIPSGSRDYYLLGASLLAGGSPVEAEKTLKRAIDLDPKRFWSWFVLGICHMDQNRFLEAAGDFGVCNALEPAFNWPYLNRGIAYARAGRPLEAREAYDRALEIDPKFTEAYVNRGLVNLDLENPKGAERDLSKAIELSSSDGSIRRDPSLRVALGLAKARCGKLEEAERELDELLLKNPRNISALVARGYTRLLAQGRVVEAVSDFETALKFDNSDFRAHLGMALALKAKSPKEALDQVDLALDAKPGWLDGIEQRALLRARLGSPGCLDDVEILKDNPTARCLYNAACAVAVYQAKSKDPSLEGRAIELLRRAINLGQSRKVAAEDPDLASLAKLKPFKMLVEGNEQ